MFEAYINRSLAYQVKSCIGLITFSTRAAVSQPITDIIEDFRNSTRGVSCSGYTALWDALALAHENLSEYGQQFPGVKKRIICLSDGEDTKSVHTAERVCLALQVVPLFSFKTYLRIARSYRCRFVYYRERAK